MMYFAVFVNYFFLLKLTSASYFIIVTGESNGESLSFEKSHFVCDRDRSCTHVKYNKGSKEFTLVKEGDVMGNTDNKNEIVWQKGNVEVKFIYIFSKR